MLRSIYSLIHRIFDTSEKKYNNTKSRAVIFCYTNSIDDSVKMNMELNGKQRKIARKPLQHHKPLQIQPNTEKTFKIETNSGNVICKHQKDINIIPMAGKDKETSLRRLSFTNNEADELKNVAKERPKSEGHGDINADVQPNAKQLIEKYPEKRLELVPPGKDQFTYLMEQITKMKTGLERLQEIAVQFNCSQRFNEDINYLIKNIRPHLENQARKKKE
ncbi:unnamed protein product [Ceutorhynchus assimilis]|uniref:Uncharacterized protein n=1 Tax=Ceutorhynchus assimilis TaxID=467358 RepID=A0A9N9MU80_9CUCU|nr:unnamed protein product [Ceutorhynchus assimilis]